MFGLSPIHLIILLLIVVLIFGTKKLKNVGSDLGAAVKGFKDGMKDGTTAEAEQPPVAGQVTNAAASKEADPIDVQAKEKS